MENEYLEVPVSGAVITAEDKLAVIDVVLKGWFTEGDVSAQFGNELKKYIGVRHASLCNSGSSANLLAVTALKHQRHKNDNQRLVITCATGFPTTVYPIIQNNLIPLFVDADPHTLNARTDIVLELLERKDVCGIIVAHTLGFPYDAKIIREKCDELDKWFVEDCADALGAEIYGQKVGSFGHASTFSFFPAHHITSGEGGAVLTDDGKLHALVNSYRDWGRDCWCLPGQSNTCNKRFDWHLGDLPDGWDHKYTFSNVGYNLKITEMQSALGLSQLRRIDDFMLQRRINYRNLLELRQYEAHLKFYRGEFVTAFMPSPFGFPVTVTTDIFTKQELVEYLESRGIRTRPVFGGNLVRHPAFKKVYYEQYGLLEGSDYIMERTFWIGLHPALTQEQLNWEIKCFEDFFEMKGLR